MNRHHEVSEELKEMKASTLEGLGEVIYEQPSADYFKSFPEQILEAVHREEILKNLPTEMPFSLPQQYFEEFSALLLQKLIHIPVDEEIEALSPILAGLKDKMPFEKPKDDYFKSTTVPKPKTIAFSATSPAERKIKWMRWVAAAAVLCIFSLGGYSFLNTTSQNSISDASIQRALASIPDAAIQQYLSTNMDAYDVYSMSKTPSGIKNSRADARLLNSISDKEIEKILEEQIN